MPTLAELMVAHIDGRQRSLESGGARPLEGTDRTIRHKRRVRQGTTAGIAVIAGGALATSGAVALKRAMDQEPAAYYLPEGGGFVTIPVDGPDPTVPALGIQCGDPAPEPVLEDDGFKLSVEYIDREAQGYSGAGIEVTSTVTNANTEEFRAFLLSSAYVVTRDGVVVDVVENSGNISSSLAFTPGRVSQAAYSWISPGGGCGDRETWEPLPAGDYEAYAITHVGNSREIAALTRAGLPSGHQPYFEADPWLEPLDWECGADLQRGVGNYSGSVVNPRITCLPRSNQDALWDPQARTVTLPYSGNLVSRVFTATLVSEPIPFTLDEYVDRWATVGSPVVDGVARESDMVCGATVPHYNDLSHAQFLSPQLTLQDLPTNGTAAGIVWHPFGPEAIEGRVGSVTVEPRARVYLMRSRLVTEDDVQYDEQYVVGTGYLTIGDGNPISLSRATGPARVPFEFSGIDWCDATETRGELIAHVVGEVTVDSEAGTITSPQFVIYLGDTTDAE